VLCRRAWKDLPSNEIEVPDQLILFDSRTLDAAATTTTTTTTNTANPSQSIQNHGEQDGFILGNGG